MERKLVTEEELIAVLNTELRKHDDSGRYSFMAGVVRLAEVDETECNWSDPYLQGGGVSVVLMAGVAENIVAEAKKKYNLR
ncbi:MAG: hypothetical protein ABSD38_27600 [Syntrophorhabdales bacterium]|jgi:hypothetical protein